MTVLDTLPIDRFPENEASAADPTLSVVEVGNQWPGRCSNVRIEPTATAIRATKQNAADLKMDPAMALFDEVTVMQEAKPAPPYQMMVLA